YPFSHCFEGPWPDGACHPTYYTHLCSFSHNYCDEYSSNVAELTVALESGNDQLLSRLLEAKSGVRRVSEFEYEIDVCDKDYVGRLVNGKEVGIVLRQRPVEALLAIE